MVLELGTILTNEEINNGNFKRDGTYNGFEVISKQRRYYFLDKNPIKIDSFSVAATVPKREYDKMLRLKQKGKQSIYRKPQ